MRILNICNSISGYGSLKKALKNWNDEENLFPDAIEYNFQIVEDGYINIDFPSLYEGEFDSVRIWGAKLNINECIFASLAVEYFKGKKPIEMVWIGKNVYYRDNIKFSTSFCSFGEANTEVILSAIKNAKNIDNKESCFLKAVNKEYLDSFEIKDALLMIDDNAEFYYVKFEVIKYFILTKANDYIGVNHLIGMTMGQARDEHGWILEDRVVFKLIIDLINEGELVIEPGYHKDYSLPIKVKRKIK